MTSLIKWLRGPRFDDPEDDERAQIINFTLVLGLAFLCLLSTLYAAVPGLRVAIFTLLPVFVLMLTAKWLLHRGSIRVAAWVPVGTLMVLVSVLSFLSGGYRLGLPPILVLFALMGALMLGRWVGLALTGWAIAIQVAVYWFGASDVLLIIDSDPQTLLVAITVAQTAMVGFAVSWGIGRLRDEAGRARRQAKTLEENQSLLEDAARRADAASQAKSRFLATMSHELRTPLNAILGYSEILLEDLADEGDREDVNRIHRSGAHLLSLVDDVLDMSKIEAGQVDIHLEWIHVPEVIEETVQLVLPVAQEAENTLTTKLDPDLRPRLLDRRKLSQILLNLLSNATKFTHHGQIEIEATMRDDSLCIAVSDTGIGVRTDQVDRLFRPFEQADNSARRRHGGSGLGLAISLHYAEMMQGRIDVRSTVGRGSTFEVWLPDLSRRPEGAVAAARGA